MLQDIVQDWDTLAVERRRRLFNAALMRVGKGDWGGLEQALKMVQRLPAQ